MNTRKFFTAFVLSFVVAILSIIASAVGLFGNVYRDNRLVTAAYQGNDLVTLVVVAPVLIASIIFAAKGSAHWLLVWLGCTCYMLYNYIFYMYGAAFNPIFLMYVLLVCMSLWALIHSMPVLDVEAIRRGFSPHTPVIWIAVFMLLIPVIIGGIELGQIWACFATGDIPQAITQTGHPTGVIYATDLAFLMPAIIVGAVLLWMRKPWGYVLGTIVMIKGVSYPLALIAMSVFSMKAGTGLDELLPFYVFFLIGSTIALVLLLRSLKSSTQDDMPIPG